MNAQLMRSAPPQSPPRTRFDATDAGFVLEVEEDWEQDGKSADVFCDLTTLQWRLQAFHPAGGAMPAGCVLARSSGSAEKYRAAVGILMEGLKADRVVNEHRVARRVVSFASHERRSTHVGRVGRRG